MHGYLSSKGNESVDALERLPDREVLREQSSVGGALSVLDDEQIEPAQAMADSSNSGCTTRSQGR